MAILWSYANKGLVDMSVRLWSMKPCGNRCKLHHAVLAKFTKQKNVLVVLDRTDEASYLSLRNLNNVHVIPVDQLNAYDVLNSDDLVFTKAAIEEFIDNSKKEA